MKCRLGLWVLVLVFGAGCAPALKDLRPALSVTDSGNIWFATAGSLARSPDGSRFLPGDPVVISGELRFPKGFGPFPAVILAHGCGGIGNAETGWAPILREWGYGTFIIDSFRGRGLVEVCTQSQTLAGVQRIPDAYGALRILVTHPRIDAQRVALMGFSHGGILTMGACTAWAKETYVPPGQPAFRAFFAFYPNCNTVYPERERVSAPVRIHIGELDDWTPARSCLQLTESLRLSGQDISITIYPGAHHSFDNIGRSYLYLRNADNGAGCVARAASILGPFPPPRKTGGCLKKGATIAWNPEATEQARSNLHAQLTELLK